MTCVLKKMYLNATFCKKISTSYQNFSRFMLVLSSLDGMYRIIHIHII